MSFFRRTVISNQVIKGRSDKIMKRALRDAKKKIKKGEIIDSHSLSLYLHTVDQRYAHIKADINSSTIVYNYAQVRANKIAETRQLLDFFSRDHAELERLYQIVEIKSTQAGLNDDFKHQKLSIIDLEKLKESLDTLTHDKDIAAGSKEYRNA